MPTSTDPAPPSSRSLSRRHFTTRMALSSLGIAAGFPAILKGQDEKQPEPEKSVTLSILHTTDLHGHILPTSTYEGEGDLGGLARCATQVRQWQTQNPNNILIDIGDVYQGTHVSRMTGGQVMIDLFNKLNYDAWVIGNHELDWGLEPLANAVEKSRALVLGSNAQYGGMWTTSLKDKSNPLGKIAPYIIKEVAGFRVGIIGSVTPGLPAWLHPGLLSEFSAADPLKSVQFAIRRLQEAKVDAIVLAAHFGLKGAQGKGVPDDFANRIHEVTKACPELAVVIAGHTHKDIPDFKVNGIPYTQGNYYGINCGRVDLVFDAGSRKLQSTKLNSVRMDKSIAPDPMVLSASAKHLDASKAVLATVAGKLETSLPCRPPVPGAASPALLLITRAIRHGLQKRGVTVDGVLHGLFQEDKDLPAGPKTVGDIWDIIPYENRLATADIRGSDLTPLMEEMLSSAHSTHALDGFKLTVEGERSKLKVTSLTFPDGRPIDPEKRYTIALNAYDAQSGGRRYELLHELVIQSKAKFTLHAQESRDALVEFFTDKKVIKTADLA